MIASTYPAASPRRTRRSEVRERTAWASGPAPLGVESARAPEILSARAGKRRSKASKETGPGIESLSQRKATPTRDEPAGVTNASTPGPR